MTELGQGTLKLVNSLSSEYEDSHNKNFDDLADFIHYLRFLFSLVYSCLTGNQSATWPSVSPQYPMPIMCVQFLYALLSVECCDEVLSRAS